MLQGGGMKSIIIIVIFIASISYAGDLTIDSSDGDISIGSMLTINPDGSIGDCVGDPKLCEQSIADYKQSLIEREKIYVLKTKLKYIDILRGAAHMIYSHADRWGLNDQYRDECREAYNETFEYEPSTN